MTYKISDILPSTLLSVTVRYGDLTNIEILIRLLSGYLHTNIIRLLHLLMTVIVDKLQ